jgi:hypothetical protein
MLQHGVLHMLHAPLRFSALPTMAALGTEGAERPEGQLLAAPPACTHVPNALTA